MTAAWTVADLPDQRGRTVLVTGATSGLGLASARALAGAGARVLLGARDVGRAERAREEVAAVATGADPGTVSLDLADLDSVRAAAADVAERVARLDVLMNNAGVMALPLARTAQGFELQIGTNHLGHAALTGLLLPTLLAADGARVVTTSSNMHKRGRIREPDLCWEDGYRKWPAYSQSKLANLLFALELDRRARAAGTGLVSVAAHPGYAATHLQAASPAASGSRVMARVMDVGNALWAQSAEDGALPQLYAATMPDVRGGDYWGPDGFLEMRGAPVRATPSARARDRAAAARLWARTEELTGVTFAWPSP